MMADSFIYNGKEYQVDKVVEVKSKDGKRSYQIVSKDSATFELSFEQSVFKWVLTHSNT